VALNCTFSNKSRRDRASRCTGSVEGSKPKRQLGSPFLGEKRQHPKTIATGVNRARARRAAPLSESSALAAASTREELRPTLRDRSLLQREFVPGKHLQGSWRRRDFAPADLSGFPFLASPGALRGRSSSGDELLGLVLRIITDRGPSCSALSSPRGRGFS